MGQGEGSVRARARVKVVHVHGLRVLRGSMGARWDVGGRGAPAAGCASRRGQPHRGRRAAER
eukprot:5501203-Prymnesium_polylepis.1